jgi:hypothetical protein
MEDMHNNGKEKLLNTNFMIYNNILASGKL